MALDKISEQLLSDIFSAALKSPKGLNALRFRADKRQFLAEINQLESLNFIRRKGDLYFITPLTVAQLSQNNLEAQELVRICGLIFAFLQGAYIDNPGQRVTVPDLSRGTGLPESDVRIAFRLIIQMPILGAHSADPADTTRAFLEPAETILKYNSFEDLLKQMQEGAEESNKRSRESGKLDTRSIKYPIEQATGTPIQLFDALQLHPNVIEASRELFEDGHYRDAIYRAFVEVNNFVKKKTKRNLDGKSLMSTVFRPENPIIKLNLLETQSDKDEQEGFMFLFMGAMQGVRNPKAHENIIQNDPYKSLKYLSLASLLIETIDV